MYSAGDVIAQCASYCFDASTFEIWGALLVSSHLVIVDHDHVLDPELLLATMERHDITTVFFTTALFNALSESRMEVLTRLKCVMFGGERASVPCVQKVLGPKALLAHADQRLRPHGMHHLQHVLCPER